MPAMAVLFWCSVEASAAGTSGFRFSTGAPATASGDSCLVAGLTTKAPMLDGDIGEQEWASAGSGSFTIENGPVTRFYALIDDNNLYLAFDCAEPTPQRMRALHGPDGRGRYGPDENGDVHAYNDDCVEVFLFPKGDGRQYQFVVNAVDDHYDGFSEGTKDDPTWKGDWTSKTRVTADSWKMEMRIGLKSVGLETLQGASPRITFTRARFA